MPAVATERRTMLQTCGECKEVLSKAHPRERPVILHAYVKPCRIRLVLRVAIATLLHGARPGMPGYHVGEALLPVSLP